MPSTTQAGDRDERLRCPRTRERIGEDPARWLDRELITDADRREIVLTLIDSMDSIERVRAWRACELRLANPQDDDTPRNPLEEPRPRIMQRLDQREEWLELHGERPDRLEPREHNRDLPPVETEWVDRPDVETASDRAVFRSSGSLATDGGEPE